jgi:type VI secretion system protein ImpK
MTTLALTSSMDGVTTTVHSFSKNLRELMEDGIYLLFLLRNGSPPNSVAPFRQNIDLFLDQFETNAHNLNKPQSSITDAKYAFCALLDEIVLSSNSAQNAYFASEIDDCGLLRL